MENYIVRIYRRGECQPDSVIGLVESIEIGEEQPFSSLGELTRILAETSTIMEKTATEKLCLESA